jgi:hypothetical protein
VRRLSRRRGLQPHAGDAHALRRAFPHEFEIGEQRLHLPALGRQVFSIQASPHAAVDPIGQRENLVVDQHGKGRQGGYERRREGLEPGVQMAVLAGEVVASVAHGGIGRVLADMARRIDD